MNNGLGKVVERSIRAELTTLYKDLSTETEEKHEKPQSE
jgi:hypothetical protein